MQPGNLAFIKTTGEQVLVASHPTDSAVGCDLKTDTNLSGAIVRVFRPIAGQDGIRHELEALPIELLETAEARFNREYEEFSELQAKARVHKAETQLKLPATDVPTLN